MRSTMKKSAATAIPDSRPACTPHLPRMRSFNSCLGSKDAPLAGAGRSDHNVGDLPVCVKPVGHKRGRRCLVRLYAVSKRIVRNTKRSSTESDP